MFENKIINKSMHASEFVIELFLFLMWLGDDALDLMESLIQLLNDKNQPKLM
jgi:hypothetical protein